METESDKKVTKQDKPTIGGKGKRYGNRNRKPNRNKKPKPNNKPNENQADGGGTGEYQDPFWYAKEKQAINNMANYPFLEVVGSKIGSTSDRVGGLMVINYNHAISNTTANLVIDTGNYATRAAKAFYNYVVQGFTGGVDFEAPDLIMASLAANSLFALMIEGKRAYSACDYYLQFNKYYASAMVNGLGFDYDSLVANKADFRAEFNLRVAQINKVIAVPKQFFIGDRWEFLASHIFTDTTSPEYSTGFAYVCNNFLQYDSTAATTGTCLRWYPRSTLTATSFFTLVDTLIDALDDDDIRSMFGAIRRVYTDGDLKQLTELDESLPLSVVHNDVVSAAVHNMSWAMSNVSASVDRVIGYLPASLSTAEAELVDCPIYQDSTGNIICNTLQLGNGFIPYSGGSSSNTGEDVILDMYDHMVSPENVLDITANIQVSLPGDSATSITIGSTAYSYYPVRGRSEIITTVNMVVYSSDTATALYSVTKGGGSPYPVTINNASFFHLDSHPLIAISTSAIPTYTSDISFYLGEIDRYTVLSRMDVARLHDRTMYQLLLLPENTKSVTK